MKQRTSWEDIDLPRYPHLSEGIDSDVVVVGGGLCGVLTTYLLAKAGKRVVLLEKDRLGSDATKRTTAFITQAIDTDLIKLISLFGKRRAKLVWESGGAAIDMIEQIVRDERIDCEFERTPAYIYARKGKEFRALKREASTARRMGFEHVSTGNADLGIEHRGYMEVAGQAKFHPMKFLDAVARAAVSMGAKIFEQSEVVWMAQAQAVRANGKIATGADIVITTYAPFNKPLQTKFKKGMYVSYVLEARMEPGSVKEGIFWDQANPYHYMRVDSRPDHDRIIFGGEDHRAELHIDPARNFGALEDHFRDIIGDKPYQITSRWSGPILEPSDGLPLIGSYHANQTNRYIATAFSGNGMTYSMIAAKIFLDKIMGVPNPWAEVYDPRRGLSLHALLTKGRDYVGEFFGGAVRNSLHSRR